MAVDLGSANTLVYVRGDGIVLCEHSGVGNGLVADVDLTERLLRYLIRRVHRNRWAHPRVVLCVPTGATSVHMRALGRACLSAGARQAYLIEKPIAAAIGAGLPVAEPAGSMILDIGGTMSEVAVISLGGIVASRTIGVGGDHLDEAIIGHLKREHRLLVDRGTAEEAKLELGSAVALGAEIRSEVSGHESFRSCRRRYSCRAASSDRRSRSRSRGSSRRSGTPSLGPRPSSRPTSSSAASCSPEAVRCCGDCRSGCVARSRCRRSLPTPHSRASRLAREDGLRPSRWRIDADHPPRRSRSGHWRR